MEPNSAQLKSGAVITIGVVVFTGLLLYVGDLTEFAAVTKPYKAHFTDVQFIKEGTAVTIGGVRVGRVSEVVSPSKSEKRGLVLVRIEVESGLDIRRDSALTLKRDGLLGERYIELKLGDEPGVLEANEEIAFTSVDPTLADIGRQVDEFRPQIASILTKVEATVDQVNDIFQSGELSDIVTKANEAMDDVRKDVAEVKTAMIEALDRAEATLADVQRIVQENEPHLKGSMEHAEKLLAGLQERIDEVKSELLAVMLRVNNLMMENQAAITKSIDNLEKTTWNMERFSAQIKENPQALIFGGGTGVEMEPKRDESIYRRDGRLPPYPREQ